MGKARPMLQASSSAIWYTTAVIVRVKLCKFVEKRTPAFICLPVVQPDGRKPEYGLTDLGKSQALAAG